MKLVISNHARGILIQVMDKDKPTQGLVVATGKKLTNYKDNGVIEIMLENRDVPKSV